MLEIRRHFGLGEVIIIFVTFTLFVSAVFTKGFTHDLLLETAVFLVSLKLIVMAYKNVDATDSIHEKLDFIIDRIKQEDLKQKETNTDTE